MACTLFIRVPPQPPITCLQFGYDIGKQCYYFLLTMLLLKNHGSYAKEPVLNNHKTMSNLFDQMQAYVKDADKNLRDLHLANEDGSHLLQTFFFVM